MKKIYVDLPAVAELVSLGETTIQGMVRNDEFPKSRLISGRRVAWLVREVEEWAESRPVSDLLPPMNTGKRKPKQQQATQDAQQAA